MKNIWQYILGSGMVLFIFVLHMLPVSDSMLNENNTKLSQNFLLSQIRYHQEFAPFARRPMTSALLEASSSVFGITLGESFVLVNFILLWISGLLIYRISMDLHASKRQALFNMAGYFLTFSIVFAFFPPVFSYDEPLQYCFLFLAIQALIRARWVLFSLLFFLAIVARESSAFLLPGFILIGLGLGTLPGLKISKQLGWLLLPIPLYILYLFLFFWFTGLWGESSALAQTRYKCIEDNFGTWEKTIETLFSFLLVIGPFSYFLFISRSLKAYSPLHKRFIQAFFVGLLINTPIIMLGTLARESRLFALPLIFIWPLAAQMFGKELDFFRNREQLREFFSKWNNWGLLGLFTLVNYWISFKVYVPSFPGEDNFFNEYSFLVLFFISLHFLGRRSLRHRPEGM